jgi:hypothetical protein
MKRMSRCPASMLAKSRTLREMIRTNWEITSMMKIGKAAKPLTPAGTQPLTYLTGPLARTPSTW